MLASLADERELCVRSQDRTNEVSHNRSHPHELYIYPISLWHRMYSQVQYTVFVFVAFRICILFDNKIFNFIFYSKNKNMNRITGYFPTSTSAGLFPFQKIFGLFRHIGYENKLPKKYSVFHFMKMNFNRLFSQTSTGLFSNFNFNFNIVSTSHLNISNL